MSLDSCLDPCVPVIPTVILGSDATLEVRLSDSSTGDPIDITSATEIEAIILNADGTFLEKKLSLSGIVILSGPGGRLQIVLPAADSALIAPSVAPSFSNIQLSYTIGGLVKILNLLGVVNFVQRLFPAAP